MALSRSRLAQIARSGLIRQIAEQTAATLAVQVLGAVTTLSFVHLLPPAQYALFGLGLSTVTFVAAASDLGLMASMNYFWRGAVAGGPPFAERYAAIKRMRLILFAIAGSIGGGILAWLEYRQGVDPATIAATTLLVLLLAWAQIATAMTLVALRLVKQLRRAYRADLAGAVARAGLAIVAFLLAVQHAWLPLASLGIASVVTLLYARSRVPAEFLTNQPPSRAMLSSVLRYVLPTMPATIIFSTQDIFVYWLAQLSGGPTVLAQAFAIGRLAAIFVTLNTVMANVIIPRVVNLADDRHAHRNGVIPIVIMAFFCATLTGFAALFPDPVLWVLGKHYAGLHVPLVLSLSAASLQLIAQTFGQLNRTMGWIKWETPMILLHAVMVVALVPFFHFGTTQGVLSFNLAIAALGLGEMIVIHLIGTREMLRRGTAGRSA